MTVSKTSGTSCSSAEGDGGAVGVTLPSLLEAFDLLFAGFLDERDFSSALFSRLTIFFDFLFREMRFIMFSEWNEAITFCKSSSSFLS